MILVDYSGIAVSAVFSQRSTRIDENLLRHLILNSLRMYNVKYRAKYGKMIIACDAGSSWRKTVFAEYKASRATGREKSDINWQEVWAIINKICEEIREFLPYKVIKVKGAEADDVIGTMVETAQEFGAKEDVMIISADKDFIQLQKYSNVSQFSPMTKKLVTDKNPREYLIEHILRGDSGDGVPNVLSPDDVFVTGGRQSPIKKSKICEWIEKFSSLADVMDDKTYRNFVRNRHCIDLSYIPAELSAKIIREYEQQEDVPNGKLLNYLIMNRCNQLISSVSDFFPFK
jgi:5'-3' exonuclease